MDLDAKNYPDDEESLVTNFRESKYAYIQDTPNAADGSLHIPSPQNSYEESTEMSYMQSLNDAGSDTALTDCRRDEGLLHEALSSLLDLQRLMETKGNWKYMDKIKCIHDKIHRFIYIEEETRLLPNGSEYSTKPMNDFTALGIVLIIILLIFAAAFIPLELKEFPELPAVNGEANLDVVYIIIGLIYLTITLSLFYYGRKNHVTVLGRTIKIPKIPKKRKCYTQPLDILGNGPFIPTVCWDVWGENPEKCGSCCARVMKWIMDTVRYNAFYHHIFISSAMLVCTSEGLRNTRTSLVGIAVEWFMVVTILPVVSLAELRATDYKLFKASIRSFSFAGVLFLLVIHCIAGIFHTIDTGAIDDPLLVMDNVKTYILYVWINLIIFLTDAIHRPKWAHLVILFITLLNSIRILVFYYLQPDSDIIEAQIHFSHVTAQQVRIWTVVLLAVFYIKCIISLFLDGDNSAVLIHPTVQTRFSYEDTEGVDMIYPRDTSENQCTIIERSRE